MKNKISFFFYVLNAFLLIKVITLKIRVDLTNLKLHSELTTKFRPEFSIILPQHIFVFCYTVLIVPHPFFFFFLPIAYCGYAT